MTGDLIKCHDENDLKRTLKDLSDGGYRAVRVWPFYIRITGKKGVKEMEDEMVFSGNRTVKSADFENETIDINMPSVREMIYHTPCGPGDEHFVDVFYRDGEVCRLFNPECVVWDDVD